MRTRSTTLVMTLLLVLATFLGAPTAAAAVGPQTLTGQLPDGSAYSIEVPAGWNGTLLLYAHGYNAGPVNPAVDGGSPQTRAELLRPVKAIRSAVVGGVGAVAILAHIGRVVFFEEKTGADVAIGCIQHVCAVAGTVRKAIKRCLRRWVAGGNVLAHRRPVGVAGGHSAVGRLVAAEIRVEVAEEIATGKPVCIGLAGGRE